MVEPAVAIEVFAINVVLVIAAGVTPPITELSIVAPVMAVEDPIVPPVIAGLVIVGVVRVGVKIVGEVENTMLVVFVPVVPVTALRKLNCAAVVVTDTPPTLNG